jgi:hypothetical protein
MLVPRMGTQVYQNLFQNELAAEEVGLEDEIEDAIGE